jgi:hypothetical protein
MAEMVFGRSQKASVTTKRLNYSVIPFAENFERSDFDIYQKKGGPHGTADHQL